MGEIRCRADFVLRMPLSVFKSTTMYWKQHRVLLKVRCLEKCASFRACERLAIVRRRERYGEV